MPAVSGLCIYTINNSGLSKNPGWASLCYSFVMANNNREVEIKFKVVDVPALQKKLRSLKARRVGKAFERTVRFDTPGDDLEKSNKFVRVRTGFKNVVTFKQKLGEDTKFKVRKEIELEVSDPQKMEQVIEGLGFTKRLIMEKYREKWEVDACEVVIDELPFGVFTEIEGSRDQIVGAAKSLGFKLTDGITVSYWELWHEFGGTGSIVFNNPSNKV